MKPLGLFLCTVGTALLLLTIIGQWTPAGNYKSAGARHWERFDPLLAEQIGSFSDLMDIADQRLSGAATDRQRMEILYAIVADGFTHGEARHTPFSNWVLYLAGRLHSGFSHIWDPERLVANGHSLFCDQASYVLLSLALAHGIRSRHVGLNGHVVMEAWYDSDWHLYDPDLEVRPFNTLGKVMNVEQLAADPILLEHYYRPHGVESIVGSREDNTFMSYPQGARFEWKSNVLAEVEKAMEVLKFVIPVILVGLGLRLVMHRRTAKRASCGAKQTRRGAG